MANGDPYAQAYELCKLQAAVDGAFPEELLQFWFRSAWELCAKMVDLIFPPRDIEEQITINACGSFALSHRPSSEVQIFDRYTLVAVIPPSLQVPCHLNLCCYCGPLKAKYRIGEDTCELPPRFVQAVARLFTYMVENRGDTQLDDQVLGKCGALLFLGPDLAYVA